MELPGNFCQSGSFPGQGFQLSVRHKLQQQPVGAGKTAQIGAPETDGFLQGKFFIAFPVEYMQMLGVGGKEMSVGQVFFYRPELIGLPVHAEMGGVYRLHQGEGGFLAVGIPNAVIAIVQEMRAKRVVDKLSVTTEPKASVVRDGELIEIPSDEIVLGDVMYVEMGRQVLSDGVVIEGLAEANESMLTGESDAIKKAEGDRVLAGSYLVSGGIYVKVTAVGKDNYVTKIERAAKNFKAPQSNLFRDLNNLVKYIGIFMIPMTIIVAISNWFVINEGGIAIPEGYEEIK